jgi:MoxR-like ATPase
VLFRSDDVKALAEHVLAHRLIIRHGAQMQNMSSQKVIAEVLETVPVPGALPHR